MKDRLPVSTGAGVDRHAGLRGSRAIRWVQYSAVVICEGAQDGQRACQGGAASQPGWWRGRGHGEPVAARYSLPAGVFDRGRG